jgi:hypothetical protein
VSIRSIRLGSGWQCDLALMLNGGAQRIQDRR